jgi:hypothetical protein
MDFERVFLSEGRANGLSVLKPARLNSVAPIYRS